MVALELVKPWRLLACMPLLLYGALLLLELPNTLNWALLTCGVVLACAMLAARVEYSMPALLPAFAGLFLLVTCISALFGDVIDYTFVPFTDTDYELLAAAGIGAGYIAWGITSARRLVYE
jgi:hypothetical protein